MTLMQVLPTSRHIPFWSTRSRRLRSRPAGVAVAAAVAVVVAGVLLPAGRASGVPPVIAATGTHDRAPGAPQGLTVDDRTDPLAVQGVPQFGWQPTDPDGHEVQSAYELRVVDGSRHVVWDSGQVASSAQSWIDYAGPALAPGTTYQWSVRSWDRSGLSSPWATAHFDTGLTDQDWSDAQWIRRTPAAGNDSANDYTLARSSLAVTTGSPVVRARAYVAAMGDWQLDVNGTTVDKTSSAGYPGEGSYDVSDLTALVRAGKPLAVGVSYHYWTCTCQGRANGPVAGEGPSGLLVKVVVQHADGTSQTLVTDGSWKVTQNSAEQISARTYRNGDSGDRVEYVDASKALAGWDTPGYDAGSWSSPQVIGPHPRPAAASCAAYEGASSPCTFTHLVAQEAHLRTQVIHPVSVLREPDGTVFADFGKVYSAVPSVTLSHGVTGRGITMTTSYREANTTSSLATSRGARTIALASVADLHVGDQITVDAPADGYGAGHPETAVVKAVSGTTVTLASPLRTAHAAGVWVENSRAGTSKLDTQGSNMRFYYTETNGRQVAQPMKYWAWRYLEISDPGQKLTTKDISAIVQNTDAPHAASFASSNTTLDSVFTLMQRSALQSAQDTFLDTPTREKGQFLGDAVDESFATMSSLDERSLTRQAIVDFINSQNRYWVNGAMNAVYPNGDAKRDIPDYTEMFPEWVMRYYQQTGDTTMLAMAYPAMKKVADYIDSAINAKGLVYQLPGGSGPYQYGIIDWPSDMRFNTIVNGNGAELVVNALAVGANRSVSGAAAALSQHTDALHYRQSADSLSTSITGALRNATTGLYSDGLATDTLARLENYSQHAQTYAVDYGIADPTEYPTLGRQIAAGGMQQGPMDLRQLESALGATGQTSALVSLLTDPSHIGPAQILAEGGTFMWENWNPGCTVAGCTGAQVNQNDNTSFSHGWGAAGINGILESLLGITVTGAGAATVQIAPPATGLTQAGGTEWTERGPVTVNWRHVGPTFTLDVTAPDNVSLDIVLPTTARAHYATSGAGGPQLVQVSGGNAHFTAGSGTSHLTVTD